MAEQPNAGKSAGFAGLAELASDVEALLLKAQAGRPPPPAGTPADAPLTFADALEAHADKERRRKWILPGIGAACYVAAAIWIVATGHHEGGYVPPPPRPASMPRPVALAAPASPVPAPVTASPTPAQNVYTNAIGESAPPVGSSQTFSIVELHYCMAQKERIAGARAAIDHSRQSQVARFNLLVEDFNSRCAQFRYRPDDKERVTFAVENEKAQLRQQGAALLGG